MTLDPDSVAPRRRPGPAAARRTLLAAVVTSLALHVTILAWSWFAIGRSVWIRLADPQASAVTALIVEPPPIDPLGSRDGLGDAISDMDAPVPLQSILQAQNQPLMGLTRHGPLRPDEPDARHLLEQAETRPPLPGMAGAQSLAEAMRSGADGFAIPSPPVLEAAEAEREAPAEEENGPEEVPQETAEVAATDPGPAAGREVDLFAKEASTELRAGSAESRQGRDHRIRGLRRSLNAFLDSLFLPRPIRARYRITLDNEGTPALIDVVDSTGSQPLDLAIRRQLFNSWFDPDPAGDGSDLGRPFHFSIVIH